MLDRNLMQIFRQEVSKGMRTRGNAWACFIGVLVTMALALQEAPESLEQIRARELLEEQQIREQERLEKSGEDREFELEIPDVRGLYLQGAQEQLEQWGKEHRFQLEIVLSPVPLPEGAQRDEILVFEQELRGPMSPSAFPQRSPFEIHLYLGAKVPDVTGHTLEEARQDLRQRGLVAQAPADAGEDWIVHWQSPRAGEVMPIPGRVGVGVKIPPKPDGLIRLIASVAVGLGLIAAIVAASIRSGRGPKQRRWVEHHVRYRLDPGSFLARVGPSRGYASDRGERPLPRATLQVRPTRDLRSFLFGDEDPARALEQRLPRDQLLQLGKKLGVDSRAGLQVIGQGISRSASDLFKVDPVDVLVSGWCRYHQLVEAARKSLSSGEPQTVVLLAHTVTLLQTPLVEVLVDGVPRATVYFELGLELALEGVAARVFRGRLVAFDVAAYDLKAFVAYEGRKILTRSGPLLLPRTVTLPGEGIPLLGDVELATEVEAPAHEPAPH